MQQLFSSLKLRIISIHNWYCSKNKASRYAILAVVLLGLWMLSGAVFSDRGDKKAAVPHPAYSIEHSTAQEKHSVVKVSGIAGAKDAVSLMAQDSGIVSEILVQDGQFVKEGTLLMKIDSKNYAELLEKANAAYKAAEIDYRASEILFKKKLLSEANLVKSQADLHSAKATLVKAELDLKNSSVVAPFDGYVDYISAHVGDYISGPASMNTPVVGSFFAGKSNIVKVEFSEYDRKQINLNDEALVYFDNIKLNGNVTLLSSVKDTSNNSFRAEITIDGSIPKNINGQDVDVVILGSTVEAHKIPQSALSLDIDGKIGVKIVDSNKIFHPEEKRRFRAILNNGMADAFRAAHPDQQSFSWWDYRAGSWKQNKGMRIDYLLVSPGIADLINSVDIDSSFRNLERPSDHAPVLLSISS